MLVVERSLDPASESHNFRLDLYCRNRRLRAKISARLKRLWLRSNEERNKSLQTALHDPVFFAPTFGSFFSRSSQAEHCSLCSKCGFKKEISSMWRTYCSWLIMAPLAFGWSFLRGAYPTIWRHVALQFLDLRNSHGVWFISRLVDDRRGLCRNRDCGRRVIDVASARRRARRWLVRVFRCDARVCDRFDSIDSDSGANRARDELQRMSLAICGLCLHRLDVRTPRFSLANTNNAYGFICYIVFATELNDVASFTFGRLFGRHPSSSKISPSKTWEGALGAPAVSMLLPWLFRFSFSVLWCVAACPYWLDRGIGGQLGDLSISVIKRDIGTKDMAGRSWAWRNIGPNR